MDQLQPFTFTAGAQPSSSDHDSRAAAPLDRPSFTFIDHDDDLTSKRIKDVNARKAIRSHVMRDVRRRERLAGLKRTSRRENRGQRPDVKSQCKVTDESEERRLVLRAASQSSASSPSPVETESRTQFSTSNHRRGRPTKWMAGHPLSLLSPSPRSLPNSWFMDPFCSLPGSSELPSMVAHLVFYWKSVFVPMTFPSGLKDAETPEVELMVRSSFSDPGSFFGLMSMCAAHRAALAIDHLDVLDDSASGTNRVVNDPDYFVMKAKSIREMNAKVKDPKRALTNEAFDTIVNLLTGSLIAGLFDEVRVHLTGLKRMVELRGGITDESIRYSSILSAILTADVKAGSGLLAKPVFPLTWQAQPVPCEIQQRIRPPASSPIRRLGSGFWANTLLSQPLLRILNVLRDIVFYGIAVQMKPAVIHPSDHDFFRLINCEVEHQLLSYVYTETAEPEFPNSFNLDLDLHPIEIVTRVASICFINHFLIVSPPSSGLGRALTKHLMKAINSCHLSFLLSLPKENFGPFAWALFIGAQGSLGRPERPWFVERLARVAMICEWQTWDQVSRILCDYFFLPVAQDTTWRSIWDEAMAVFVIFADES
ncbi:uncharacterized protein N7459_006090 [Penicillium hispanicum]|uniref:uncharacterized protein n=1 Tax=Penicillium hispanicum TaxID=1080232 RepID=UPI002540ACD8|nr:uncharacterized protein N7459_006090 [Penicillium hispanicum]KAJ5580105.1 hypothetical protein N7459_006090 [Penicillium hispanicum]